MLKFVKYQLIQKVTRYYCCTKEMKYLNVAEKNDAAKTIAAKLSSGTAKMREGYSKFNKIYDFEATVKGKSSKMVMTSVCGHLMHLEFLAAYRNWNNINPQTLFDGPVRKSCTKDFEPIKRTLEREIRSCQGLIIWTDCDREGENIGFEIIDVCRAVKPNIIVHRAVFSEITAAAVKRALQNLTAPDKRQSDAVDVRIELDLRSGAAITRFQTLRLNKLFPESMADKLISYGSCQIPTLGFVAERYKEIEAFVSEPFWKIKVTHTINDLTVEFTWARNRLFDKQACEDYYILVLSNPKATVEKVTVKPKHKWRPLPMDTVELEKLGSRKLKLSAKEVMTIAEKLYTRGLISYPRTETNSFSKDINLTSLVEEQINHSIWGSFAQRIMDWGGPNPRNGNKSDQSHPPIHPTKMVTNLGGNEARVYELICRHFLACVSKDAIGSETIVNILIEGEKFSANGLVIHERNYLDVYIYDKWNAKQIHHYVEGQVFIPTELTMPEGATTPPALLTEADLIALMEKHGIGTDATHAEHINTIKERGYIGVVDNGFLVPGVIGMGLYEGYNAMQLALAKPILRAEFEVDLKRICLGEKDPKLVLQEQVQKYKEAYKQIMDNARALDEKMAQRINATLNTDDNNDSTNVNTNNSNNNSLENNGGETGSRMEVNYSFQELFQCPKCKIAPLALKMKKNQSGFYIGCLNYPDCKNVIWLPDECKEPKVLNESCSRCGELYKLLKLKFSQSYHKTLFKTPTGWYKTCLPCDIEFRNTFNINVDCVKTTGPIVSDVRNVSSPQSNKRTNAITTAGNNENQIRNTSNNRQREGRSATAIQSKNTNSSDLSNSATNIRSYFTSAKNRHSKQMPEAKLRTVPSSSDFFNDDDDIIFNDIELNIENPQEVNNSLTGPSFNQNTNYNGDIQSTTNGNSGIVYETFDDSISGIINMNNNDNDDYVWGTAARNAHMSQNLSNSKQNIKRLKINDVVDTETVDYSWGSRETQIAPKLSEHAVKCQQCQEPAKELCVKKDGPNKGRIFYVCSKNNLCKFFQWADSESSGNSLINNNSVRDISNGLSKTASSSSNMSTTNAQIKCNCNQLASRLTVRKDGPNKGKEFYGCANRSQSCGFFKWADGPDEVPHASTSRVESSNSAGTSHNNNNNSILKISTSNVPKARKCGLCRKVGHSRQKCPRKEEFEF